jgi:hypothetical protein
MALGHSPQIVTNGLVFYYDMGNPQKSWKGAPTTNVIQTNLNLYDKDNGCTVTQLPETFEGNPIYRVVFPAGTLPRIRTTFAYTAGQQYTGSIYYKVVSQGSHTPQLIFRENGFGTTYTSVSLTGTSWQRTNITHTFSGSGTSMFLLYQSNSAATTPTIIDFSMPQTELRSFATPFVNGTRSNTQAILDLTNNNTITATSLTYASDGTFSFNGSANFLSIPNTTLGNGNVPWTVSCWMKTTTAVNALGLGSVLSNISGGPVYSMMGVNSGKIVYWTYQNSAWAQKLGIGKTVNDGNWHMLTWVNYSNSTMDMYVDGLLDSNVANSTSGNNNPVDVIGRSWAGYFPGSIASLTRYTRALSAAEVQQNFNALRGRYGL